MKSRASRKSPGLRGASGSPLTGADLARKWADADVFSPAFAGCMCAGGFHIPIDASAVAQDLLIYLEDKYRSAGETTLADFLARSLEHAHHFGDWLAALDEADLPQQASALLMEDLRTTLVSMSGSSGFACV